MEENVIELAEKMLEDSAGVLDPSAPSAAAQKWAELLIIAQMNVILRRLELATVTKESANAAVVLLRHFNMTTKVLQLTLAGKRLKKLINAPTESYLDKKVLQTILDEWKSTVLGSDHSPKTVQSKSRIPSSLQEQVRAEEKIISLSRKSPANKPVHRSRSPSPTPNMEAIRTKMKRIAEEDQAVKDSKRIKAFDSSSVASISTTKVMSRGSSQNQVSTTVSTDMRVKSRKLLQDAIENGSYGTGRHEASHHLARAIEIEQSIHDNNPNQDSYKSKAMGIAAALRQGERLCQSLLEGTLAPKSLTSMTKEQLRNYRRGDAGSLSY